MCDNSDRIVEKDKRIDELKEELDVIDSLLRSREDLLKLIPACSLHGDQCVPHAMRWVKLQIRKSREKKALDMSEDKIRRAEKWLSEILPEMDKLRRIPVMIYIIWSDYDTGHVEKFETKELAEERYVEIMTRVAEGNNGEQMGKVIEVKELSIMTVDVVEKVRFL